MSSFQTCFEGSDVGVIYEFLSARERAHHVVSLLEATSTRLSALAIRGREIDLVQQPARATAGCAKWGILFGSRIILVLSRPASCV